MVAQESVGDDQLLSVHSHMAGVHGQWTSVEAMACLADKIVAMVVDLNHRIRLVRSS